jgi:AbrB family looped-hinge helix DNA binding protein
MKATIDKAGRVVIPKAIRERAGFRPGMELEIEVSNGRVALEPAGPQGRIVYKNGLPYWETPPGTPPLTPEMINEWIRQDREDRHKF